MVHFNLKMLAVIVGLVLIVQSATQAQVSSNLALDASVTGKYTSPVGTYPVKNAVDGNLTTAYRAPMPSTHWIEVDLDNASIIQQIEMLVNNTVNNFSVDAYYNDGDPSLEGWYTFTSTVSSGTNIIFTNADLTAMQFITKIRVNFTTTGIQNYIYDLKVLGSQLTFTAGTRFQDPRDGQLYPTAIINGKCWMQKNMNYAQVGSEYYNCDATTYQSYGRLYPLSTSSIYDVCPSGWRLPTETEFDEVGYSNLCPTGVLKGQYAGFYSGTTHSGFGNMTLWASSTVRSGYDAVLTRGLISGSTGVSTGYFWDQTRTSVRCILRTAKSLNLITPIIDRETGLYDEKGNKINIESLSNLNLNVYPNPSTGKFSIDLGTEPTEGISVEIFSTSGKEVYHLDNVMIRTLPIELREKGLLLIKVTYGDQIKTEKIILK